MTNKRYNVSPSFNNIFWVEDNSKPYPVSLWYCTDRGNADNSVRYLNQMQDYIEKVDEENKQLKESIDELRSITKEQEIEAEHINNIYKAFGFKGIIEYAKERLAAYGAVHEVDSGLWLLATGGWSDHEFWLECLHLWNFMYAKGHYCATIGGGGYYYSEEPYADITIKLENKKELGV